jgi:hypothetical protein
MRAFRCGQLSLYIPRVGHGVNANAGILTRVASDDDARSPWTNRLLTLRVMRLVATVSVCLTVGFSHVRYPKGNRT